MRDFSTILSLATFDSREHCSSGQKEVRLCVYSSRWHHILRKEGTFSPATHREDVKKISGRHLWRSTGGREYPIKRRHRSRQRSGILCVRLQGQSKRWTQGRTTATEERKKCARKDGARAV